MATRKRAKKTAKQSKFPKTIYVTHESANHPDDEYLAAWFRPDDVDDEQEIAVYELVRVGSLVITKEVE